MKSPNLSVAGSTPMHRVALLACALVLTGGAGARGAVVYLDATMANTDNSAGGADSTWAVGDDTSTGGTLADGDVNGDGFWGFRSTFGHQGIWEANIENAPELVTTATGLANGTYDVYVFFRSSTSSGQNWQVRAGLVSNPGANPLYGPVVGQANDVTPSPLADGNLSFVNPPDNMSATQALYYAALGQAIVSNGTLSVYVDDRSPGTATSNRSWYEGIGYELVSAAQVPSPAALPAGLALLLAMTTRRRRAA